MAINITKGGLRHAWNRHRITKADITQGIDSVVSEAFLDKRNMSIVIFTKNNLCICIDYITRNLNTAFVPKSTYNSFMHDKCKQIKFNL